MQFLTKYEKLQSFMLAIIPLEENDKTYEKLDNCKLNVLEQHLVISIGLQFFYFAIRYYKIIIAQWRGNDCASHDRAILDIG
jgi:hypothetical protein